MSDTTQTDDGASNENGEDGSPPESEGPGVGTRDSGHGGRISGLRPRLSGLDGATKGILAITALAMVARLVALGHRVMHFDEGRVAYWALDWTRTGTWHYRYIVHGPFIQWVDHWLFAAFGSGDFVARLPVAVVGGLLPLAVLLYREHFSDGELVGMALLLSANPIMLYYSRFMRSDVLVAAFMFVSLGALVRTWDTANHRYLYAALAFAALGFASKENAIVYPVTWVGMLASVAAMELLYPRRFASRDAFVAAARDRGESWLAWGLSARSRPWVLHLVGAVLLFGALTVFFYAPRGYVYSSTYPHWVADPNAGLWAPGGNPIRATIGGISEGFDHWLGSSKYVEFCSGGDSLLNRTFAEGTFWFEYGCYLGRELLLVKKTMLPLAVLSVIGFVSEWTSDRPRVLVPAAFAWGVASIVGYPIASDIFYPSWLLVHVAVPLAIPGAAGLGVLARWGREALADEDFVDAAVAVGIAVLLVTSMVGVAAHHAYVAPQAGDNSEVNVAQYAQPTGQMQGAISTLRTVSERNDGVDVVVYGSDFVDMGANTRHRPHCVKWLLPMAPLSWYLYSADANVSCVADTRNITDTVSETDPPIIIASASEAHDVADSVGEEYVRSEPYHLRLGTSPRKTAVFFYDTEQVDWNESG